MGAGLIHLRRLGGALVCAAIALLASVPAHAAPVVTPAQAKAVTLRPLSIVKLRDLDFGRLLNNPGAGTVTINPNTDARTTTGGVVAAGGSPLAAQFYTYGGPRQFIYIQADLLPVLNRVGGGASMPMTAMTLNGAVFRYLDDAGLLDLRVGGTLQVNNAQMEGTYVGTFNITVTYF